MAYRNWRSYLDCQIPYLQLRNLKSAKSKSVGLVLWSWSADCVQMAGGLDGMVMTSAGDHFVRKSTDTRPAAGGNTDPQNGRNVVLRRDFVCARFCRWCVSCSVGGVHSRVAKVTWTRHEHRHRHRHRHTSPGYYPVLTSTSKTFACHCENDA